MQNSSYIVTIDGWQVINKCENAKVTSCTLQSFYYSLQSGQVDKLN